MVHLQRAGTVTKDLSVMLQASITSADATKLTTTTLVQNSHNVDDEDDIGTCSGGVHESPEDLRATAESNLAGSPD